MRPWPSIFPQEMFRSTKMLGLVLVVGSLVALGAVCVKWPGAQTNTSVNAAVTVNTTPGTNSSISNGNENTNSSQNTNSAGNTNTAEIDTSDWLTYTNEEYGFSFRYPDSLEINNDLSETDYTVAIDVLTKEKDPVMGRGNSIIFIGIPNDIIAIESEISSYVGVKKQNIQINNQSAVQYTFYQGMEEDATKPHNTKRILVEHNGKVILIVQTYFNVNNDYDNWFDGVENTLKFF